MGAWRMQTRRGTALVAVLLLALLADTGWAQSDQRPRPPKTGDEGLLAINRDYFELSAATGGEFYFWAPGEFASANLDVPGRGDDVVLAYGNVAKSPKVFETPVESGAKELVVFCGVQRKDLAVLVRPDGTTVRDAPPSARVQSFRYMIIVSVASPDPGIWKLELSGAGTHAVTVRVRPGGGTPSLDRFEFVEMRGRPGHEGWFEIERDLVAGETLPCQAELDGHVSGLSFTFVDRDGTPVGSPHLQPSDDGYFGQCAVPSVPFRVVATGADGRGGPWRRMTGHLIVPGGR